MAGQTTNLHLKKPEYTELGDVAVINENMDTIDEAVKQNQDDIEALETWKPTGNGTSGQILRTNGDGTTRWDNAATQEEIEAAAETWLAAHVSQGETLAIDDTLTLAGYAADSEVVGDKVTEINHDMDSAFSYRLFTDESVWEAGTIKKADGTKTTSTVRMRCKNYLDYYISKIETVGGYLNLFAYENDVYKGVWTSAGFVIDGTAVQLTEVDIEALEASNPTYRYKIIWGMASHDVDVSADYVNIKFTSKCYELRKDTDQLIHDTDILTDLTGKTFNEVRSCESKIFDFENVAVYETTDNRSLIANGQCEINNDAELKKYAVTQGDILYLKLTKDNSAVYQFQKASGVPRGSDNNNLVGSVITTATDAVVTVPDTATYLIVSQNKTNVINTVKKATSIIEEIEEEVDNLLNSIDDEPTQNSGNLVKSGGVYTAVNTVDTAKINRPTSGGLPDDGTEGQILRTKGNGQTEWVDPGTPTSEQVESAIIDWMDEHPEARVLIDDGSITEPKFADSLKVKAIKDYVTPEMFGEVGAGDDTEAVFAAINYAVEHNVECHLLGKTYIIASSRERRIELHNGANLVIRGNGSTILKRKDNSVTANNQRLFWITCGALNDAVVEKVMICDLTIDSNARNQPYTSGYTYEHCADFRIDGGTGTSSIKNVIISNVSATDGVADHFLFPGGDSKITNVYISNFHVDYRNRTRSDICVTGWVKNLFCSNSNMIVFEYEYNDEPTNDTYLFMDNVRLERIDIAGRGKVDCKIANIMVTVDTNLTAIKGSAINSSFQFKTFGIQSTRGLTFDECKFVISAYEGDKKTLELGYYNDLTFNKCQFMKNVYDPEDTNYLITTAVTQNNISHVVFDTCVLDENAPYGIFIQRTRGEFDIRNMTLKNSGVTLYLSGNSKNHGVYNLENIVFDTPQTSKFKLEIPYCTLNLINVVCRNFVSSKLERDSENWLNSAEINGFREILVNAPLTVSMLQLSGFQAYLNFDTYVYAKHSASGPQKWIRTSNGYANTGIGSNNFAKNLQAESMTGNGPTANRPTELLCIGYQYYDTTTGKLMVWNGSGWSVVG